MTAEDLLEEMRRVRDAYTSERMQEMEEEIKTLRVRVALLEMAISQLAELEAKETSDG